MTMETNCQPEKYLQLNDPFLCRWMIIAIKLAHFLLHAFEVTALRLRDYLSAKEKKNHKPCLSGVSLAYLPKQTNHTSSQKS